MVYLSGVDSHCQESFHPPPAPQPFGRRWSNSPILLLILTLVSPQLFEILQNLNWDRASWNIKCPNEKIQIQSLFYTNFCKAHFHQHQSIMSILGNLRTSRRRNFGADDLSSCSLVKPGWKILPSDITFLSQAKSTSTLLSSISLFCVKNDYKNRWKLFKCYV